MAELSGALGVTVVYRTDTAKGGAYWSNRYEIMADVATDGGVIGSAFAEYSKSLLLHNFWVDHVVVSTLAPDSEPYDPDVLTVWPVNERGNIGAAASLEALPLTTVLHLSKFVSSGRLGRIFLRGYLQEGDITSDLNGGVSLANPGNIQITVTNAYSALTTALGMPMSMISTVGGIGVNRVVGSLVVKGIAHKSLRTTRKSSTVRNAIRDISGVLGDGAVGIEEIPTVIENVALVVKLLTGSDLPPLLP